MFLIISLILISTLLLHLYTSRNFDFWKKQGIPYATPSPFFGNIYPTFTWQTSIGEYCKYLYENIKAPLYGFFIFDEPYLLVNDLNLIKNILVKDFNNFLNRTMTNNEEHDPIGSNILFLMKTPHWRDIRRKMTPAFSSGKIKLMFKLIDQVGADLVEFLDRKCDHFSVLESRELCAKFTTDAITSTSFGLEGNCFKEENAPFRVIARRLFNWKMPLHAFQTNCFFLAPKLVRWFRMAFIDSKSAIFIRDVFWGSWHDRGQKKLVRNDLIDILIEMMREEKIEDETKLEGDRLVAQALQFFIAGYETTSSTMSFALWELAKNPEIQEKLRDEIQEVAEKMDGLSYESIQAMRYLDRCLMETLRLYPILPFLDRRCTSDYQIPGTDIILKKGQGIYIPIMGIQRNPQYFPEPLKFDPERFLPENIEKRHPFSYLPFGEGPRNCIGKRYALVNAKCGLAHLLLKYKLEFSDKTQDKLDLSPRGFLLQPTEGIYLKFIRL